ncbi:hypothetical protein K2173_019475 [Erythroxylum novogranatense]|uniref:ABC transporter domain-containing protein n=1 Tax=Erythroxylum novogranatense TaxID=1862640 RepID=A0AAV8UBA4_9ROSI|nr:hypothetical protein K2173_019475 [Erythroxylum novogranatense]
MDERRSKMSQVKAKVLDPIQQMELHNYTKRSIIGTTPSPAEFSMHVEEAQVDASSYDTPVHDQVLQLGSDGSNMPPSNPFVLSFNNLTYSVEAGKKFSFPFGAKDSSSEMSVLLNDISGETTEGEIMAILGPSGAGKSTLIDALAGRISKESLKGSVTLNGEVLDSRLSKAISAYVMQDDLLFPMLTVEETLMFAAEFRLPRSLPKSKKKGRVEALIDQLGLRSAANTVIGDEGHRGVSGGERRRVSIGTGIIHDPIILFLDEPTSGLDSTGAFMVVNVLQRIAESGSIVIMTIHQPSYRILSLLDQLIFLSRGQTVYSGSPDGLPAFSAQFGRPIPDNENRCEFVLDLIRELEEAPEGTKNLVEFNKSWQAMKIPSNHSQNALKLSLNDAICASISKGKLVSGSTNAKTLSSSVQKFANPFWIEMIIIAKRSVLNSRRTPQVFGVRFGTVFFTAIILATIFRKLDNSATGAHERIAFVAYAMATAYFNCAQSIPAFLGERFIFMRETAYNAYRRSSYVIAHSIISIPALIFLSIIFVGTTFWTVGLAGGFSGFLFFFFTVLGSFWAGSSFITFISGVVSSAIVGFTVALAILSYFLLFCGFFINRDRIPPYWRWFHYISLIKYPYEAALESELHDRSKCFVKGVQMFDSTPFGGVPLSTKLKLLQAMSNTLGVNITSNTCMVTASDILRQQGITDISKWNCLWILVVAGIFFRALFYLALLLGSKKYKRR